MKKIAIYGTGRVAEYFMNNYDFKGEKLSLFIETKKSREEFLGYPVIDLKDATDDIDIIYFANTYADTVFAALEQGINPEKMVVVNKLLWETFIARNGEKNVKYISEFAEKYEKSRNKDGRARKVLMTTMNNPIDMFNCDCVEELLGMKIIRSDDYCRFGTMRLLFDEIISNNVQGSLAELGVYQGELAKYINKTFPDRELHLFDTFEGFCESDVEIEKSKKFTSDEWFEDWNNFKNTSLELVMNKMTYPEKCVVHKGFFPDTIPSEEINYAFVSLDCDLYEPILEGLRYFYPRLNNGGYLFIHDYNQTNYLRGVKQAVHDYENEIKQKLCKAPITDVCGTLVVCK